MFFITLSFTSKLSMRNAYFILIHFTIMFYFYTSISTTLKASESQMFPDVFREYRNATFISNGSTWQFIGLGY